MFSRYHGIHSDYPTLKRDYLVLLDRLNGDVGNRYLLTSISSRSFGKSIHQIGIFGFGGFVIRGSSIQDGGSMPRRAPRGRIARFETVHEDDVRLSIFDGADIWILVQGLTVKIGGSSGHINPSINGWASQL